MILLECPETGERQLVRNAVGYGGWKLISRKAPAPPGDHCEWCCESGQWKPDAGRADREARLAAMRDPEMLLAIIERLPGGVEALDALIAAAKT